MNFFMLKDFFKKQALEELQKKECPHRPALSKSVTIINEQAQSIAIIINMDKCIYCGEKLKEPKWEAEDVSN